jgi:hypothetical protein
MATAHTHVRADRAGRTLAQTFCLVFGLTLNGGWDSAS